MWKDAGKPWESRGEASTGGVDGRGRFSTGPLFVYISPQTIHIRMWKFCGEKRAREVLSGPLSFKKEDARPDDSPYQGEMSRSDRGGRGRASTRTGN